MSVTASTSAPAAATPDRKPIRAVVVDVDGTLLTNRHDLSPRTEAALKACIAQGIEVILATGKTRNAGLWLIEKLGIKSPGIYLQGLYTTGADGRLLHEMTLKPTVARQVITYAEERGFAIIAYSGMRILARTTSKEALDATEKYHEPIPEAVGALQNQLDALPIHKLLAVGDPRAIMGLRWQLNLQLGSAARLMQAGVPWMLEILPPGGSKAAALKLLLRDLNIPASQVLAIGDAENDSEMIQMAGIGVAMGNAAQSVKDIADHVTTTNDEDGVGLALERFVLPPKSEATPATADGAAAVPPVPTQPSEQKKEG